MARHLGRLGRAGVGAGCAGRAGAGGAGRWASERRALGRGTGRRAVGGRTRGARGGRGMSGRRAGTRAATQPCWPATRPRLLRNGASERSARGLGMAWALGGCAGWVNWAKLVHCAPGSVLTWFLDPVRLGIFLSH